MQLFKILISLGLVATAVAQSKIKISQSKSRVLTLFYIQLIWFV